MTFGFSVQKIKDMKPAEMIFRAILVVTGLFIVFLVMLTKSKTISQFNTNPLVLVYTIFVTTFEFSRLIGALFYDNEKHLTAGGDLHEEDYEPTASFVVPCYNEGEAIAKTVHKCFEADYPKDKLEVIIINDGSTDNTLEVLTRMKKIYPRLVIIDFKKNMGKRHGMYAGFEAATGEIIVQLDSDSYIVPETFRELIRPFRNKEIGAVCAHADPENADKNFLTKMQAAYYFLSFRILKAAESTFFTVFCCSGCSSAYRKDIVMPIMAEWLEEKFLGLPVTWGDDRALTNWVIKLGFKTIYTDKAMAYTICPEKLRQLMKQQVRWKKGWFVNSIFASKFIWKKEPFVAFTYFFPLILLTLSTPFMATKALIINPIFYSISPLYYVIGIFLISSLVVVFYRFFSTKNKYWAYVFAWSAINMLVLSFILFYALFTIQNRKWGTR